MIEVDPVQAFDWQHGKEALKVRALEADGLGESADIETHMLGQHAQRMRPEFQIIASDGETRFGGIGQDAEGFVIEAHFKVTAEVGHQGVKMVIQKMTTGR